MLHKHAISIVSAKIPLLLAFIITKSAPSGGLMYMASVALVTPAKDPMGLLHVHLHCLVSAM